MNVDQPDKNKSKEARHLDRQDRVVWYAKVLVVGMPIIWSVTNLCMYLSFFDGHPALILLFGILLLLLIAFWYWTLARMVYNLACIAQSMLSNDGDRQAKPQPRYSGRR